MFRQLSSLRSSAILLLACAGCGAERRAQPIQAPVVAVAAVPKAEPEANTSVAESACRRDVTRALELAHHGDQTVKINVEGAISDYTSAAQLHPTDHRILWKLAWAYEKTEQWSQLAATMTRATELAPHFGNYWFKLGFAWIMVAEAGDKDAFERAKLPLEKCIERDPNIAECHYLLGQAQQWTDDEEAALAAYSAAIQHDPRQGYFYPPLAELYLALGLPQQAEAVLKEGTRLVESSGKHRSNLYAMYVLQAQLAQRKGDLSAQLKALENAQNYADDLHPEFAFNLGATYAVMDPPKKEQAIRLLNQFTKRVCRGGAAMKYKEQCEIAASLMQRLGVP